MLDVARLRHHDEIEPVPFDLDLVNVACPIERHQDVKPLQQITLLDGAPRHKFPPGMLGCRIRHRFLGLRQRMYYGPSWSKTGLGSGVRRATTFAR